LLALDRDPAAIARGEDLARLYAGRLTLIEGRFSEMERLLAPLGIAALAGVALDLGVSSAQIDDPARGFSFRADGPLDMRMGRDGRSAADLVNGAEEAELAAIIRDYGEERHARRIVRAIVAARPLARTGELAAAIRGVVPETGGIDPATRTFQALRMAVNGELDQLTSLLDQAQRVLAPGGVLCIISFHSLEDRAVKREFQKRERWERLSGKPVQAGAEEISTNPRARSAKLRAARLKPSDGHDEPLEGEEEGA
jgi:16S rRNA (cytosine1402-N4)-methyltransferase